MRTNDTNFAGSIPDIYDDYLVPLIFDHYAIDLAARVARVRPGNVLETAAGSGVVTRQLARELPDATQLTITDLNQPMLDRARKRQDDNSRITWQACDATALPFQAGSFDAVVCQFGAMFFPDRVQGYSEARRVLRSDGLFAFNVWDNIGNNEFADEITRVAANAFPDDPPLFMARTPHGHGDVDTLNAELGAAGFTEITITHVEAQSQAPSARDVAVAYCQGTPLRGEIEARDASRLAEITDLAAKAVARRWGQGAVTAKMAAYVIEAR